LPRGIKMIKEAIKLLTEGHNLTEEQASSAMTEIMTGQATNAQIASYLTALRIKGETVEEIAASAKVMRQVSLPNDIPSDSMDIVGTGGDNSNSFNISTCSSFVVAAGGVKVAKHGNRSVSSKCGAADVLTELGAFLKTTPEQARQVFDSCGFVFLHAQVYHPAMRFAGPVRGELGIRTVFNVLGPLGNPAGADKELLGVYSKEMVKPLAEVLAKLGTKRLIAVHGEDGLDEVSPAGKTFCVEIFDGKEREYTITPEALGLKPHGKEEILGGDPATNAAILRDVLGGKKGAYRDAVILNSALCFYIAGKVATPKEGARFAEEIIDSGKALATLDNYIKATNKFRV
jgi:anthranilate phosphoribosyltransferase